jgi:phage-related holin
MTVYFKSLLKTFDWATIDDFLLSLAPSYKYKINVLLMMMSSVWVCVDKWFGLDSTAFVALLLVFVAEMVSGIAASRVRKEPFSSMRLSRFSLKVACYMVLIFVSYSMFQNFEHHKNETEAVAFDWMHIFLIVQIVFENMISVLENVEVISGKKKGDWIRKLKSFGH